jgi:ketosteroid isomerase-like protein
MPNAAELLRRHLSLVGRTATPEDLSIYATDVIVEFPYAPEDHTRRLEGPGAVGRFMENIGKFSEGFKLGEPTIHETKTGCIAEYHGDAVFKSTGLPYSQDYISVLTVEDGKIKRIREYYDPLRVLRALGEIP